MTGRRENYPFPHRGGYKQGFLPNRSREKMNRDLQHLYESWKALYLTTEGCLEGELRVSGGNCYQFGTCSEGTGYGMLLSVYMANAQNHAHEEFDSIFRYYKNHSLPEYGLMRWEADRTGKDLSEYVAPDGDLDVAFALLAAHRQWGSDGEICYLEAVSYTHLDVYKRQQLCQIIGNKFPEHVGADHIGKITLYHIGGFAAIKAGPVGIAGIYRLQDFIQLFVITQPQLLDFPADAFYLLRLVIQVIKKVFRAAQRGDNVHNAAQMCIRDRYIRAPSWEET